MKRMVVLAVALVAQGELAHARSPEGARVLERSTRLQTSADRVWPDPSIAADDRSVAYDHGCNVPFAAAESPPCVYGHVGSRKTAVLFGDSHAMQYFPAFERIARRRGWRLVLLAKAGCPPGGGPLRASRVDHYNRACRRWRRASLRRMRLERPALVVAAGATHYHVYGDGRVLGRAASLTALGRGYATTLRRLAAFVPHVAVMRDSPIPPHEVVECVASAMRALRRCAFPRPRSLAWGARISRIVRRVEGVELIDPTSRFCPRRFCPAVIGDALVWRGTAHITATYARTLAPWLARRLEH